LNYVRNDNKQFPLLWLILLIGTVYMGIYLLNFRNTKLFNNQICEIIGDFSLPIAVIFMSFMGTFVFQDVGLQGVSMCKDLCMNICIYMYMFMCMYIHIYIWIHDDVIYGHFCIPGCGITRCGYNCIFLCVCICLCSYICVYIFIYIYVCIYIYIFIYMYAYLYIYIFIYMYTYLYIYIFIYIYICIHTCVYIYS
jgi:hypothetical protein